MKNVKTINKKVSNSTSNLEKTKIGLEVRKRRQLFPEEIELSAQFELNLTIPSQRYQAEWIKIQGVVQKDGEEVVLEKTIPIKITGSDSIFVSKDKETQSTSIDVETVNGQFSFYVFASESSGDITLISEVTQTKTEYLSFNEEKKIKDVLIEFENEQGVIRQFQAQFKKK